MKAGGDLESGDSGSGTGGLRRNLIPILGVGILGALVGFAYLGALHVLEHVLGPAAHGLWGHLLVMTGIGAAVSLLVRLLGSPGDVELLVDNIHLLNGKSDVKTLRSMIPISLLCVSSGGAAGPEAPLVQASGTLASWIADRARLPQLDRRSLTIAGMAAAFTVLFGAPLGSAIFALEILHRRGLQYHEALLPAILSSLVGYVVYALASGLGLAPVWSIPEDGPFQIVDLGWAAGAGAVGAAAAAAFTLAVLGARRVFHALPAWSRPIAGGAVLGLLGMASPYALTFGKYQVSTLVLAQGTAATFALAFLAKLAGTTVTVASGWRGGFIIPLFFMGAALARMLHAWFPGANEAVLVTALMAAANTGVTKTPIGSTLVVCKMAGLQLLPSTLVAAVTAFLLTSQVRLIHSQRERDSLAAIAGKAA